MALSVGIGIFYLAWHRQKGRKNSRQLVCRTQQRQREGGWHDLQRDQYPAKKLENCTAGKFTSFRTRIILEALHHILFSLNQVKNNTDCLNKKIDVKNFIACQSLFLFISRQFKTKKNIIYFFYNSRRRESILNFYQKSQQKT